MQLSVANPGNAAMMSGKKQQVGEWCGRLSTPRFCRMVEFLTGFKALKRLQLSRYGLTHYLTVFGHLSTWAVHDWDGLKDLEPLQEVYIAAVADYTSDFLPKICSVPRLKSLRIEYITCPQLQVAFLKHCKRLEDVHII